MTLRSMTRATMAMAVARVERHVASPANRAAPRRAPGAVAAPSNASAARDAPKLAGLGVRCDGRRRQRSRSPNRELG